MAIFRQEGGPQEEEQIGRGETNYREMVAIGERRNGSRRPIVGTRLLLPRASTVRGRSDENGKGPSVPH